MQVSRRLVPWLLAFTLVAAQALGLMHRVVHGQHDHEHGHGGIAALFDSHDEEDAGCRLFDPLNHEGAATVSPLVLPVVLSSFFLNFSQGECLARWATLFDARGPPSLR